MSTDVLLSRRSDSAEHTIELAAALGSALKVGDLVVLTGDLGAGKTQFTKGIARALGVPERVTSPTFALHQQYDGRLTLHHLDVYRFNDLSETLDLDLPELIESGVTVIEWGDTIESELPEERLIVRISNDAVGDDVRWLSFEASSAFANQWRQRIEAVLP